MTQADLARYLTPTTPAQLSKIEAGRRVPSIDVVFRIATLFGETIEYLLRDNLAVGMTTTRASTNASRPQDRSMSADEAVRQLAVFRTKLQSLRRKQGLTQSGLAYHVGVRTLEHISQLETGRTLPSVDLVLRLADLFGVTPDYLLRDTNEWC
jgi:transcriptional regulator with XRE-family HTH domain